MSVKSGDTCDRLGVSIPKLHVPALDNQVPQDEYSAQPSSSKEGVAGRAGSLGALLELFVSLADALGGLERVGNQLVNVRRLRSEVVDEHVLQLGNLDEGAFGRPASWLEGSCK
jgi:hypothetical protein